MKIGTKIGLFIGALIILSLLIYTWLSKETLKNINYPCVCAFDVDDTITSQSGDKNDVHQRALNALNQCKENGCKIVINTARMPNDFKNINKWDIINDLPDSLKIHIESEDDIYHGEDISNCSFVGYDCLYNQISDTKVKHLKNIADKYDIDYKKIILFDDLHHNITKAQNHGFSTVYANYPNKGIYPNFKLII